MAKKNNNRILFSLIILAIVLSLGALFAKQQGWIGKKDPVKVACEQVKGRTIIETVAANGKIYPVVELSISPDVSGEIVELKIEEGDSVKAGQLLARINPDIYKSVVDRAEAAVNAAKANEANASARIAQSEARIIQLQTQIDNSKKTYDRTSGLFSEGVVSQVELDNSKTSYESLKAEKAGLEADVLASRKAAEGSGYNVKSAEASLKESKDNLKRTTIYAPLDGVVSKLNVEQGERVVGTTQMAGTEMMRIANFTAMETRVDVGENDIMRVSIGDTAVVEIDAYLGRDFTGVVTHIANSSNESLLGGTDQITNFTVKIRLLRSSYNDLLKSHRFPFRPGMSASVEIQTKKLNDVIAVPLQSVTVREIPDSLKTGKPGEEDMEELVFLYENGKVTSRKVKVGIQNDRFIQITQGLKGGETVVSAPYRTINKKLEDDMDVENVKKEDLYKKED